MIHNQASVFEEYNLFFFPDDPQTFMLESEQVMVGDLLEEARGSAFSGFFKQ